MADLLRGVGENSEYRYSPFQASPAALMLYLGGLLCLFGYQVWTGESSAWPPWPPQGRIHVISWIVLAMSPLILFQLGWSYALTPLELVVRRFGSVRARFPLQEFGGTTATMGLVWLRFGARRLYLVSEMDSERQAFLRELEARSRRSAGKAVAVPVEREDGGIELLVEALRFPDACVSCGAKPEREVDLEASHWFGIPFIQGVKLKAPVCSLHHSREWQVRWLVNLAVFASGIGLAAGLGFAFVEGPLSPFGVLVIGLVLGAMLVRAADLLHVRTWCGWHSLGLRTGSLSGDLLRLTVYARSETLRQALRAKRT